MTPGNLLESEIESHGLHSMKFSIRDLILVTVIVFCPSRIWTTAGVGLF
jgi:hypothetical protein